MKTRPFNGLPGLAVANALPGLLDQAGVALAAMDGDGRLSMLSPALQTTGDHRGSLVVVEDVTQARAGTITFNQLRTHLVQSLNHELRTPLATILGHAELLDEDLESDPRAAGSLDAVRRAGRRLEAVADGVAGLAEEVTR